MRRLVGLFFDRMKEHLLLGSSPLGVRSVSVLSRPLRSFVGMKFHGLLSVVVTLSILSPVLAWAKTWRSHF